MSKNNKPTILITDDEQSIRNSLREILEYEGYEVLEASNGEDTFEMLEQEKVDLIFLDIKMKGMDGIEVLGKMNEKGFDAPVIMISGHGTIEVAVEATKLGAFDFLEKPPDLNRLLISVRNALDKQQLVSENKSMRSRMPQTQDIIGESDAINKIKETIEKVAPTEARVLITGDNGTGKELVAKWIHEKSRRSKGPFVEVNCAAIPADLLESELFGHEKGAFTGAVSQRKGKFELADGGTLFLDEIGDMSLDAQAKVLRALQENKIMRVGGSKQIPVNVRVISATNKDLIEAIDEKEFREDLYHRLNVIPIRVPPLRERRDDIPILAKTFLDKLGEEDINFAGKEFSDEALQKLREMPWTGNVRELNNVVERLGILATDSKITAEDVEQMASNRRKPDKLDNLVEQVDEFQTFKESAERLFLVHQLEKNDWNISKTAEEINIQRSHLYTKMKKYQIER